MIFKITFNRALIISFLWHLFCFFAVTIIIVPAGVSRQRVSDISFIGSILDTDSFHHEFRDWHALSGASYPKSSRLFFPANEKMSTKRLETCAGTDYFLKVKPYKVSIDEILETEKGLPAEIKKELSLESTDRSFEIEGEARRRAVLFRPPSPDCQGLISTQQKDIIGEYYKVRLKIIIAADGGVRAVEKLTSCGYPEVDLLAIRYVKKWSFAPLSPDKPQNDQEGILLLKFKAE